MITKKFKPTTEQIEAARALLVAIAYAQLVKPIVEAYQRKILELHQWKISPEMVDRPSAKRRGIDREEIILDPKLSYLLADSDAEVFYAQCDIEAAQHGYKMDPGCCPFLMADHARIKAERALIDAMSDTTKINNDNIWNLGFDKRNQFIELTLRLLAPFVKG